MTYMRFYVSTLDVDSNEYCGDLEQPTYGEEDSSPGEGQSPADDEGFLGYAW